VELRREVGSGHLRHRLQGAGRQSRDGRRSLDAERQNQAFRRDRELRRAESVWGAWGGERLQAHPVPAGDCNRVLPPTGHHRGGLDRRLAVPVEWDPLEEGQRWDLEQQPERLAAAVELCRPGADRFAA
jgi:hypothetical protein